MTQILTQMMWMPFSMFFGCMNAFAGAMRGMQPGGGGQGFYNSNPYGNGNIPGGGFPGAETYRDRNDHWAQGDGANYEPKEERNMSSCNCCDHDETVKLVEYTIVSIKPCDERIIKRGQVIYADDMDDDGFAAWVIARYLQGDDLDEDDGYDRRHERRGSEYGEGEDRERESRDRGRRLSRDEKRYLRVYHRVLESWRRPEDCCDNRQIDVLRDIERAIRGMRPSEARA